MPNIAGVVVSHIVRPAHERAFTECRAPGRVKVVDIDSTFTW